MKKADFILTGDIHIRETIPIARTDDYEAAQWQKIAFINNLAKEHECSILCAGDFFDYWKPSPSLLSKTIEAVSNAAWRTIYGDHDLPQHNIDLKHKSGLYTLAKAGKITILNGGHGFDKNNTKLKNPKPSWEYKDRKIFVWHILTWKDELPFPDCTNSNAKKLLKKYPQFDLIVTGDNHKPFVEKHKGRLLVNVGSMMRLRADQINYKPAVWLYYAKTNTVKKVYLPIEKNVITREHLEEKEKKDKRIEAFISKLKTEWNMELSFENNLEIFFQKNKTKKKIKNLILKAIENRSNRQ